MPEGRIQCIIDLHANLNVAVQYIFCDKDGLINARRKYLFRFLFAR